MDNKVDLKAKVTYFVVIKLKNKKHWKRVINIYKKINGFVAKIIMGTLASLISTIVFYGGLFIHSLYEGWLFLTDRKKFEENLYRLYYKTIEVTNKK